MKVCPGSWKLESQSAGPGAGNGEKKGLTAAIAASSSNARGSSFDEDESALIGSVGWTQPQK